MESVEQLDLPVLQSRDSPHRRLWRIVMQTYRVFRYFAAALLLFLCSASTLAAQNPRPTEYDVEAAYLFNFGKFVTWPQGGTSSRGPFTICILGADPFGPSLDTITAGEKIAGRAIIDRRILHPQDALSCSILYVSASEAEHLDKVLAAVRDAPVLTVSDIPGFIEHGGTIQFVLANGRVRFQVNLGAAQQDGLGLSSELLKVADKVTRAGQEIQ